MLRISVVAVTLVVLVGCSNKPSANTTPTATTVVLTTTAITPTSSPTPVVAVTAAPTSTSVAAPEGTIDNFGDRLRAQVTEAMVRYENGFRACATEPVGCDRAYLDDVTMPDPKARLIAGFDKRITDKIRRRPNPNPDLDYTVIETVEFPTDFDHADVKVCFVDGASKVFIGDTPQDLTILNDALESSRGVASFELGEDLKWRFVDYTSTETFEIGKPRCPARRVS